MSQAKAEREVLEALDGGGELAPYGSAKVQINSQGTAYAAIPKDLVLKHGISAGEKIERAYHPPTGCLIVSLDGSKPLLDRGQIEKE
jgi:hypothetical protein